MSMIGVYVCVMVFWFVRYIIYVYNNIRVVVSKMVLFSLGVQHLHEQSLRGSSAAAVLQVQTFLAPGSYMMDVGQYGQQFGKFVLKHRYRTTLKRRIYYICCCVFIMCA